MDIITTVSLSMGIIASILTLAIMLRIRVLHNALALKRKHIESTPLVDMKLLICVIIGAAIFVVINFGLPLIIWESVDKETKQVYMAVKSIPIESLNSDSGYAGKFILGYGEINKKYYYRCKIKGSIGTLIQEYDASQVELVQKNLETPRYEKGVIEEYERIKDVNTDIWLQAIEKRMCKENGWHKTYVRNRVEILYVPEGTSINTFKSEI